MELFNYKEETYKDYPTEKEFYENVNKIQNDELNSKRYILIKKFLEKNYWNRENKQLDEELLKMIGTYGLEKDNFNETSDDRKIKIRKKYELLKEFMSSLTEEQIYSNIYLRDTSLFMYMSDEVCKNIINELYNRINKDDIKPTLAFELEMSKKIQKIIPEYVNERVGIKYYKPEDYKYQYINVLPSNYRHVYEDYNELTQTIGKIAADVYFLQLNELIYMISGLECYNFQVYHPNEDKKLIASFAIKPNCYNQLKYVLKNKCQNKLN